MLADITNWAIGIWFVVLDGDLDLHYVPDQEQAVGIWFVVLDGNLDLHFRILLCSLTLFEHWRRHQAWSAVGIEPGDHVSGLEYNTKEYKQRTYRSAIAAYIFYDCFPI